MRNARKLVILKFILAFVPCYQLFFVAIFLIALLETKLFALFYRKSIRKVYEFNPQAKFDPESEQSASR